MAFQKEGKQNHVAENGFYSNNLNPDVNYHMLMVQYSYSQTGTITVII